MSIVKIYVMGGTSDSNLHESNNNTDGIIYTNDVSECDFVLLFHRIHMRKDNIDLISENNVPIVKAARDLAIEHGKKLIYFCGNDRPPVILPNDQHTVVVKECVELNERLGNEFIIGTSPDDRFDGTYLIDHPLTIGFVGHLLFGRKKYIDYLSNSGFRTNFIIRENYFHTQRMRSYEKRKMTEEYFLNIKNNLFTFCYRGAGNFSERFYETLMMGRIPIVINTNCLFPYDDIIDYNEVGLFIHEYELDQNMNLGERITAYYEQNKHRLIEIQQNNRALYLKYFQKSKLWNTFFRHIKDKGY